MVRHLSCLHDLGGTLLLYCAHFETLPHLRQTGDPPQKLDLWMPSQRVVINYTYTPHVTINKQQVEILLKRTNSIKLRIVTLFSQQN